MENSKIKGTVKSFKHSYGFIGRDGGPDVFVYFSDIMGEGYKKLHEGDVVEFDIGEGRGGRPQAKNVTIIQPATQAQAAG